MFSDEAIKTNPALHLRILVVDDHPLFRIGVVAALKLEPDLKVCAEADSAISARKLAEMLRPDAAVVDLMLRDDDGLRLVRELRRDHPRMKIVVLSMLERAAYEPRAIQAGANVFVSKEQGPGAIIAALRNPKSISKRVSTAVPDDTVMLSERELHVFTLLGQGRSTQEIARGLNLSNKTIETHRENIKGKLCLPHGNALVARAALWVRKQGLVA